MSESDVLRRPPGSGKVTCEVLIGFLIEYLSGELPAERASLFEDHLARCSSCVAYLETYRTTIELARGSERAADLAAKSLPAELEAAILAARR